MPLGNMARITTVVTGVAGSPYYIRGYFEGPGSSADDQINAWHAFVVGSTDPTSANYPGDATVTTEGFVPLINPVDGAIVGSVTGDSVTTEGNGLGNFLPPSNQVLVKWQTGVYVNRREVRGRTNIPCQSEAASTAGGTLEPIFAEGYDLRAETLISDPATNFVIWSKKNGEWHPAVSAEVWNQFSILRSRRD